MLTSCRKLRFIKVMALSTVVLSCCASPSMCETIEFAVPVLDNFGTGSFDIDLGVPAASVTSVLVRMSGIAEFAKYARTVSGAVASCDSSIDIPMDFSISVRSEEAVASYYWEQSEDGAFLVDEAMNMNELGASLLADGTGSIAYADLHHTASFIYDCYRYAWECLECRRGGTLFDSYPIVSIEFDSQVASSKSTWGQVKAWYR